MNTAEAEARALARGMLDEMDRMRHRPGVHPTSIRLTEASGEPSDFAAALRAILGDVTEEEREVAVRVRNPPSGAEPPGHPYRTAVEPASPPSRTSRGPSAADVALRKWVVDSQKWSKAAKAAGDLASRQRFVEDTWRTIVVGFLAQRNFDGLEDADIRAAMVLRMKPIVLFARELAESMAEVRDG